MTRPRVTSTVRVSLPPRPFTTIAEMADRGTVAVGVALFRNTSSSNGLPASRTKRLTSFSFAKSVSPSIVSTPGVPMTVLMDGIVHAPRP